MVKFFTSILFTFLLCCFSCKGKQSNTDSLSTVTNKDNIKVSYYDNVSKLNLPELVHEFILTSSLNIDYTVFKKNNIYSLIDETTKDFIIVKINYKADVSDMPLKWCKIDFKNNKLYDTTNGLDNSLELNFDSKLYEILKNKFLKKDSKSQEEILVSEKKNKQKKVSPNCYEVQDGYDYIKTCFYSAENNTIKSVYYDVAKSTEFKKEELLTYIPKTDTLLKREDKLTSLEYKNKPSKELKVNINYPGGVTYIEIFQQKDSIKLVKTYSSD